MALVISFAACAQPRPIYWSDPHASSDRTYEIRVCPAGALSCDDVARGALPSDCVYNEVNDGSLPSVGVLADEPHLFIVTARERERCGLVALACERAPGRAGAMVDLTLEEVTGTGCGASDECRGGECVARGIDAGRDAGFDAGLDAGVDAGLDAGVDGGCPACDVTWVDVSAGDEHTCGVARDGRVFCWGANGSHQLGVEGEHLNPVLVDAGLEGFFVDNVEVGADYTCVVERRASDAMPGHVRCWGSNSDGQLGNGRLPDDDPHLPSGIDVLGINEVAYLATGSAHVCGGVRLGDVLCWGRNLHGELGRGPDEEGIRDPFGSVPDLASNLRPPRAITAGAGHSCVSYNDGATDRLLCWGNNAFGAAGQPAESAIVDPAMPVTLDATMVVALDAGGDAGSGHTCVVTPGRVFCWGRNDHGQLGIGVADEERHPTPTETSTSDFIDISAGGRHTCAIRRESPSTVFCWGDNAQHQLAMSAEGDVLEPYATEGMPVFTSITRVSAGGEHTCIVADGQIYCWGANSAGQLGRGFTSESERIPAPIEPRP
jgi:alpha-tubulin suppressor-like RCC1 family protein